MTANKPPLAVFGWPSDVGGCGWYRVMVPLRQLALTYRCPVEIGEANENPFSVAVAQRTSKPVQSELLDNLLSSPMRVGDIRVPKVVYELDDDFWTIEKHNPSYGYYKPGSPAMALMEHNISSADLVTVSTETLADVVRQFNKNVVVLPNSVPNRLINETAYPYVTGTPGKPLVLGWAGSATHEHDFAVCAPAVSRFMRLHPDARMVFVGQNYAHLLDASVRDQCRYAGWVGSVPKYYDFISKIGIDIALAPLEDTEFNASKSPIRPIEMAAMGIPVVASNIGPYADHYGPDGDRGGILVSDSTSEWFYALSHLAGSLRRAKMSQDGRQYAERFTIANNVHLWHDAYQSVLAS